MLSSKTFALGSHIDSKLLLFKPYFKLKGLL